MFLIMLLSCEQQLTGRLEGGVAYSASGAFEEDGGEGGRASGRSL